MEDKRIHDLEVPRKLVYILLKKKNKFNVPFGALNGGKKNSQDYFIELHEFEVLFLFHGGGSFDIQ